MKPYLRRTLQGRLIARGALGAAALVLVSFGVRPSSLCAADVDPSKQIRTVFQSNLEATQKRDLGKALATIHSKSPVFASSAQILEKLFETFEIKFDLMAFKYIATDDGYAIARVKYKAVKVKGPEFRDYVVTALAVFKQEAGEWKLWQQANLELENLEPPAPVKEPPAKETPKEAKKKPAKDR